MALKRFGVSLEEDLLEQLDNYAAEGGFANRSQAIAFLIGKYITEQKWQCNNTVAGTVIVMYDRNKKEIASRIASIEPGYADAILSSSQYYIDGNNCMHVVAVKGPAHRLTELADRLTTIKGIRHGKLVMSRAD